MNKLLLGVVCGLLFALADIIIMLPVPINDKRQKMIAYTSSAVQAFSIGLLIPITLMPLPFMVSGAIIGALISIPSAIITGMYPQIVGNGVIGGILIGFIASLW